MNCAFPLNSLSLEDKMDNIKDVKDAKLSNILDNIEDTILLLWLFRKIKKSRRLMEKKKQRKFWVDLFLGREN